MLYGLKTTCQSSLFLNPCQQHTRTHLPIEPFRRLEKERGLHFKINSSFRQVLRSNGQAFRPTHISGQKNNYLPIVFSLLFFVQSTERGEKNFSLGSMLFTWKSFFSRKMQKEESHGMGGRGEKQGHRVFLRVKCLFFPVLILTENCMDVFPPILSKKKWKKEKKAWHSPITILHTSASVRNTSLFNDTHCTTIESGTPNCLP